MVLLVLGSLFVAMGKSHAFHKALCAGLITKAAANSLVYRKVLKLSTSARQTYSSGNIVNLMATDSERMFHNFMSVNALWAAPVGLVASLAMMYLSVHPPHTLPLCMCVFVYIYPSIYIYYYYQFRHLPSRLHTPQYEKLRCNSRCFIRPTPPPTQHLTGQECDMVLPDCVVRCILFPGLHFHDH
jgi:hypothetical protein